MVARPAQTSWSKYGYSTPSMSIRRSSGLGLWSCGNAGVGRDRAHHGVELGEELPPAVAVELAAVVRLDPVAVAEHHGAQPHGVETLVVRAQSGGVGPQLLVRFDGKTRNGARNQQLHVERRGFGQIGQQWTVPFDAGAAVDERVGHPVHARPHGGPGRNERMLVEDQDPEVAEPLVAGGRQRQIGAPRRASAGPVRP